MVNFSGDHIKYCASVVGGRGEDLVTIAGPGNRADGMGVAGNNLGDSTGKKIPNY